MLGNLRLDVVQAELVDDVEDGLGFLRFEQVSFLPPNLLDQALELAWHLLQLEGLGERVTPLDAALLEFNWF